MEQNICMLPGDMNLKIKTGTVGYNNKILISDGKFSLGKNIEVNSLVLGPRTLQVETPAMKNPTMESHKNSAHSTTTQGLTQKQAITHEEEKVALIIFWQVVLQYGICFDDYLLIKSK